MKETFQKVTAILLAGIIVALSVMAVSAEDAVLPDGAVDTTAAYSQVNICRDYYNITASKSKKIKPLKRSSKLESLALIRAQEIALTGNFSHIRPNGKRGISLIKKNKYRGENIARGYVTCAEVSEAWFASPAHRRNILKNKFKKVGIAGYTHNGTTYWVQLFSS